MTGVRLIAQLRVAEGKGDEFAAAWQPHLADVSAEPGCLQYEMFQGAANRDQIALLEHWASREAFETHWQRELSQPGGPGVPAVDHLLVEWQGSFFRTEIYDQQRHTYADGAWSAIDG